MQQPDAHATPTSVQRLASAVQRHFFWLLLACYALAALWPAPGLALRSREWSPPALPGNVPLSFPLLLLALLLFCAALLTDVGHIRAVLQRPLVLVVALAAVWLGPALLVLVAGWVIPPVIQGEGTAGLMVGLALVAAMPVANSSVGWAQHARGDLALSLALVVLSISLCPWVTPQMLVWLGSSLSPEEQAYCESLVNEFSGVFFIVWVLLPTAAGFACRYLLGEGRVLRAGGGIALASAAALLVLNYANSALALPQIVEQPAFAMLAVTCLVAALLSVIGLVIGSGVAGLMRLPPETGAALVFGLSMKHTGLALILAGAVLAQQPLAILVIVLATLMQHLLAGLVQWWLHRAGRAAIPTS